MISNELIFIHKQTINSTVTMINDDILKIYEIDEIRINLKNQSIVMTDVLYVSDFDANLLFILVLNRKNFLITFHKKEIEMQKKNILIVTKIVKKKCIFYARSKRHFESSKKKFQKNSFLIVNQ